LNIADLFVVGFVICVVIFVVGVCDLLIVIRVFG
jgi:hypothetical protein